MRFERTKNIILTLLIVSSVWMTGQIWFNEKLWPNGYDFFVVLQNSSLGRLVSPLFGLEEATPGVASKTSIAVPHVMIVSTMKEYDHANLVITQKSDSFSRVSDYIEGVIKKVLIKETKTPLTVTEELWQNSIYTGGIYVDYGVAYHTRTFGNFLDILDTQVSSVVSEVKEFAVVPGDSVTNDVIVLVRDNKTDQIYRFNSGASKSELSSLLSELSAAATTATDFSFHLKADQAPGKVLFNSHMALNQQTEKNAIVSSKNTLLRGNGEERGISAAIADKILRVFQINPNTVKKYTDASSTQVFIENQATLKFDPQGVIDYRVLMGARGLKLSPAVQTTNVSAYRNACYGADFMDQVITAADVKISGIRVSQFAETASGIRIGFDYIASGLPVVLKDGSLCVEMEIEGGYLKSYRQYLRSYEPIEGLYDNLSTYKAADQLYSYMPVTEGGLFIKNMMIGYVDDMTEGEKKPDWIAEVEGSNVYITGFDGAQ